MKVGIIGAGRQGVRRAQAINNDQETELVAVADIDFNRAKALSQQMRCQAVANWEEIMEATEIKAVLICTPPHLHAQMSIAALEKGKHVLCEKPLARNPEEAKHIVDAAKAGGMKLKCGFNHRHHPGIQKAREWFDKGVIGELNFIRCRYGIGGRLDYDKEWRAHAKISGGGELMDQGIHILDLCRWFMGEFSQVFGFLSTRFWDIAPLEDNAFALLRTEKGQVASIHASWTQWKNLFSLELFGQEGYILVEGLGGSYGTERAILGKRDFLAPFKEECIEFRGEDSSWQEEWREFVAAIREQREPLGNGYDGLEAVKLAYAIYDSAHKGCVVPLKH